MAIEKAQKFSLPLILIHWLTLLLFIGVYACIELRGMVGYGLRDTMKQWHFVFGVSILVLTLIRIVARFASKIPAIQPKPPAWQMATAHTMEFALYVFMLAMPVLGYLAVNAYGHPVSVFGANLPVLVGANEALGEKLMGVHGTIANIGYVLIAVHAGAALYHHYFVRDNALRQMLPYG
ncbi:MAG: cytochrome b [Xanthomonadaceae bacterium]|jgi:cytochrome b561|nr:cytochrome b [Xanthomonadaceae bacterium]